MKRGATGIALIDGRGDKNYLKYVFDVSDTHDRDNKPFDIWGSGAKNAAVLLYSIAREQKKTKGAARLESMLRSGKPLKVYTFRDSDLPKFKEVAKQYGIQNVIRRIRR